MKFVYRKYIYYLLVSSVSFSLPFGRITNSCTFSLQLLEKKSSDKITEKGEDLECLCKIMNSVGVQLDHDKARVSLCSSSLVNGPSYYSFFFSFERFPINFVDRNVARNLCGNGSGAGVEGRGNGDMVMT